MTCPNSASSPEHPDKQYAYDQLCIRTIAAALAAAAERIPTHEYNAALAWVFGLRAIAAHMASTQSTLAAEDITQ